MSETLPIAKVNSILLAIVPHIKNIKEFVKNEPSLQKLCTLKIQMVIERLGVKPTLSTLNQLHGQAGFTKFAIKLVESQAAQELVARYPPEDPDIESCQAIIECAKTGTVDEFERLLSEKPHDFLETFEDKDGSFLLHIAARHDNRPMILYIASTGFSIDRQSTEHGTKRFTPLMEAVIANQVSSAELLIELGAKLPTIRSSEDKTAMEYASPDMLERLRVHYLGVRKGLVKPPNLVQHSKLRKLAPASSGVAETASSKPAQHPNVVPSPASLAPLVIPYSHDPQAHVGHQAHLAQYNSPATPSEHRMPPQRYSGVNPAAKNSKFNRILHHIPKCAPSMPTATAPNAKNPGIRIANSNPSIQVPPTAPVAGRGSGAYTHTGPPSTDIAASSHTGIVASHPSAPRYDSHVPIDPMRSGLPYSIPTRHPHNSPNGPPNSLIRYNHAPDEARAATAGPVIFEGSDAMYAQHPDFQHLPPHALAHELWNLVESNQEDIEKLQVETRTLHECLRKRPSIVLDCTICLIEMSEFYTYDQCGHLAICKVCQMRNQEYAHKCPSCRREGQNIRPIYLG